MYIHHANIYSDYIGYGHITEGDKVKCLQAAIDYKFGYSLAVDGYFGSQTQSAVLDIQSSYNLSCDGIVGPSTWQVIVN